MSTAMKSISGAEEKPDEAPHSDSTAQATPDKTCCIVMGKGTYESDLVKKIDFDGVDKMDVIEISDHEYCKNCPKCNRPYD
jgi:hypothetical protein